MTTLKYLVQLTGLWQCQVSVVFEDGGYLEHFLTDNLLT